MNGWNDAENAALYDQFSRKHSMYRETSRDLLDLAGIECAGVLLDLGCGTGVSTEAILERVDDTACVFGIDGSESMLQIAQARVPDARARWVNADGTEIAEHVTGADAIICNSSIWQMKLKATLAACGAALRSGGRLAFNLPRQSLVTAPAPDEPRPAGPTLAHLIQAVAVLDYGFVPPDPVVRRGTQRLQAPLTANAIGKMVKDAGLILDTIMDKEYDNPAAAQFEWHSIPVFAENALPGMPYEQQMAVLRAAYDRFDQSSVTKRHWKVFVVHKP